MSISTLIRTSMFTALLSLPINAHAQKKKHALTSNPNKMEWRKSIYENNLRLNQDNRKRLIVHASKEDGLNQLQEYVQSYRPSQNEDFLLLNDELWVEIGDNYPRNPNTVLDIRYVDTVAQKVNKITYVHYDIGIGKYLPDRQDLEHLFNLTWHIDIKDPGKSLDALLVTRYGVTRYNINKYSDNYTQVCEYAGRFSPIKNKMVSLLIPPDSLKIIEHPINQAYLPGNIRKEYIDTIIYTYDKEYIPCLTDLCTFIATDDVSVVFTAWPQEKQ